MRNILTGILLTCIALPAVARDTPSISYTEPHRIGSLLIINEGTWNCGSIPDDEASSLMVRMARAPEKQEQIGRAGGCRRIMDEENVAAPWQVVRRIGALCEERMLQEDEEVMADGRHRRVSHLLCGREAHAVVVERDGRRQVAIDVVDLAAFD